MCVCKTNIIISAYHCVYINMLDVVTSREVKSSLVRQALVMVEEDNMQLRRREGA